MIGATETAMVERIGSASANGYLGYRLKTVAPYGGELDSDEALKRILPGMPGAWVTLLGERQEGMISNGRWRMAADYVVVVAALSKRNEAGRRHGAAGEVGLYQIARDVRLLLADQQLGLDITPLSPTRIRTFPQAVVAAQAVSMLGLEFTTTYVLEAAPDIAAAALPPAEPPAESLMAGLDRAAGITDLAQIHTDWETSPPASDAIVLEPPS